MKDVLICQHLSNDKKPRIWLDCTEEYDYNFDENASNNKAYAVVETQLGLSVVKVIGRGKVADNSNVTGKALAYIKKELENGTDQD